MQVSRRVNNSNDFSSSRNSRMMTQSMWRGDSSEEGNYDRRRNRMMNMIKNAHVERIKNLVLLKEINNAHDEIIRFANEGDLASSKMMENELNNLQDELINSNINPITKLGKSTFYNNTRSSTFNRSNNGNITRERIGRTMKEKKKNFDYSKTLRSTRIINEEQIDEEEEENKEDETQYKTKKSTRKKKNLKKSGNQRENINNNNNNQFNNNSYNNQSNNRNPPNYYNNQFDKSNNNQFNNENNNQSNNDNNNQYKSNNNNQYNNGSRQINNSANTANFNTSGVTYQLNSQSSNSQFTSNNNNEILDKNNMSQSKMETNYQSLRKINKAGPQEKIENMNQYRASNNQIINNEDEENNENSNNNKKRKTKKKKLNKMIEDFEEDEKIRADESEMANDSYQEEEEPDDYEKTNKKRTWKLGVSYSENDSDNHQINDNPYNNNFSNQNNPNASLPNQNPSLQNSFQGQYQPQNLPNNSGFPNAQNPNSQLPNQQLPNQQYPNPQFPNPQYPNQQYPNQQFPNQQFPNPQFPNQQFPNPQFPNQPNQNSQNPNINPQSGFPNTLQPSNQNINPPFSPNQTFPNEPNVPISYNRIYYAPNPSDVQGNPRMPDIGDRPPIRRIRPPSASERIRNPEGPYYHGRVNSEYPQTPKLNFGKPLAMINFKFRSKPKYRKKLSEPKILYSYPTRGKCFACDVECSISKSGNSPNNFNPYLPSKKSPRKDNTYYDADTYGYYQYKSKN